MNVGSDHDWSSKFFKGQRSNDVKPPVEHTTCLEDVFCGDKSGADNEPLCTPTKRDDGEHRLDELNPEQQMVVVCALEAVIKFLTNDASHKPL